MAFGIARIASYGLIKGIYLLFRRRSNLKKFKLENLKIGWEVQINSSRIGKNVYIGDCTSFIDSEIGDYSYINSNCKIRNTIIGKFCSIGPGVKIVLGNHPTNMVSTHPSFYSNNKPFECFADKMYFDEYKSVKIGNDVWIGEDVIIPGGVIIGDGAIITSRAVVTKNVEPFEIVGGVPAKHIRYRFNEIEIEKIQKTKWWDFEISFFKSHFKSFHQINDFVEIIKKGIK